MKKLSPVAATLLVVVVVIVALVIGVAGSYVSTVNKAADYQANIDADNKDSEQILSSFTLKIQEMVQVPSMYKKDLKDIVSATFQGRYGANGSQAMMQWIKENNIQFDSSLYKNLQVTIEAGRNEFKLSQTRKLNECAQYRKLLTHVWSGLILSGRQLPAECKIVSDSQTKESFKTGLAKPIQLSK